MDFNTQSTSNQPGGSGAWNIYVAPADVNGGVIKDTNGVTTAAITLSQAGTCTDSSFSDNTVFNNASGGPAWVTTDGSLTNTGAAADYFYTSTAAGAQSYAVTFGNLKVGKTVSLAVWASRVSNAEARGYYEYSLDGSTWNGFTVLQKDGTAETAAGWDSNTT